MNVNEFMQQVQPRQKRSRLLKYKTEIAELKERGYTDQQIRDWLAKNDIDVSREAVRKFIKSHLATAATMTMANAAPAAKAAPLSDSVPPAPETKAESQAEKMRRRLREQQQEAQNSLFKHDKTGSNIKE